MSLVDDPQQAIVSVRWPDGTRCPRCGSPDAANRPAVRSRRRWRCRGCGFEFTATSLTCLHGSKIPLGVWVAAAVHDDMQPAGTSRAVRRTVRASVERTGLPAGEERLRRLVAAPAPDGAAGPLDEVTPAGRLILAVLRGRLEGATADRVAADSGLSPSHTRRCLRGLRRMEFAECDDTAVAWGYRQRRVRLWRLAMTERTLAALPLVGWHTPPEERSPETVPPEFWYLFWSGQDASTLTVADHAVHIADTLIGGFDRAARHWALQHLPLDALRTLRTMRGYATGRLADRISHAIKRRAGE